MLYEETGPDCVDAAQRRVRLRASGTRRQQRLVLARDRMGVRPLFYTRQRRLPRLRLRGEGAARGARRRGGARPDRARPDLHVLVPARAAHAVQGHLRAAAGPSADRRRRGRHGAAVLAARLSRRGRCRRARPARAKRRSPRSCARCCSTPRASACAPTCRSAPISAAASIPRSSPRPPSGIAPRPAAHLLGDASRARSSTRAPTSSEMVRGARHRAQRRRLHRAPTSARSFPTSIRHTERPILRTAPAPLFAAVEARARAAASRSC